MSQLNILRIECKSKDVFYQETLMKDLGLSKLEAKVVIEIMLDLINKWYGRQSRSPHQIARSVVAVDEPAGKPIKYCEKVVVNLTIDHPYDGTILLTEGAVKARRVKCFRLFWEAYEQGGVLSIDDCATILCVDPSTIKDYIRQAEDMGLFIPTRGRIKDIGRIPSHKQTICTLLAQGYTYTEINSLTNHSERSIERYALIFGKVIFLLDKGACMNDIRLLTKLSKADVEMFMALYYRFNDTAHKEHLNRLKQRYELSGDKSLIDLPVCPGKIASKEAREEQRTLEQMIRQHLQEILGLTPRISLMAADDIMALLNEAAPLKERLYPGQSVFIVDAANSSFVSGEREADRELIPVVLSIHTRDKREIMKSERPDWEKIALIAHALGEEVRKQGGVLSIQQVADYLFRSYGQVASALRKWHETMLMELPFKGYIEDCGLTLTHKEEIIELEMKGYTPPEISHLTKHSPESRDRYLDMFHRLVAFVRVLKQVPQEKQIAKMLGCQKSVARQYLEIVKKHLKELAQQNPVFTEVALS